MIPGELSIRFKRYSRPKLKSKERWLVLDTYIIRPLRLGTIRRKMGNMSYKSEVMGIFDFPLISYYLEGAEHKIIVDTGGTKPDGVKWQPYFRPENETLDN